MTYLLLILGVFAWAFIGGAFLRELQVKKQLGRKTSSRIEPCEPDYNAGNVGTKQPPTSSPPPSRQRLRREARDIERTIQAGVHELFGQTEEYGPDDELPPGPPKPPPLRAVWEDRPAPKPNGSGHRPKSRGKKRRR